MLTRAFLWVSLLLGAAGPALADVQKPSSPAELNCPADLLEGNPKAQTEEAQNKGRELARKTCLTLHGVLRGHEAADQGQKACTDGYIRLETSRVRLCRTYQYFMGRLDLPTAKPDKDYNPDEFKNSTGAAAKLINERANTGEMVNMFLKVGGKNVDAAKKALNAAASKVGDQLQKSPQAYLKDRMELYRKAIEEYGPLEKELKHMEELAAKLRDDFRKTAREIADLHERSEEERKKLFSTDPGMLSRNLSDPDEKAKLGSGDTRFIAKQAMGETAKVAAEQAGVSGSLGKTAAGSVAKSAIEAASGNMGGVVSGAMKDVASNFGKQALGDGIKMLPVVGGAVAPVVTSGAGAAVTVMTSPTPANQNEVWLENFLRSSSSADIDYDGHPITYPEADAERRQERQYLPK